MSARGLKAASTWIGKDEKNRSEMQTEARERELSARRNEWRYKVQTSNYDDLDEID